MRPRDLLHDGEADSSPRNVTGLCAAIETLDNPRLFAFWNGRARIMDDDFHGSITPCLNLDGRCWRRGFQPIVEQLSKRQPQQLAIGIDLQVLRNVLDELVALETTLECL